MQITFYCHLYMNENLKKKEAKIKKKLSANNLQPSIYVIAFLRVLRINWIFFLPCS